jgi:hypothetical protein
LDDVAVVTAACAGGKIVNSVAEAAEFTYPPVPERLWLEVLSVNSWEERNITVS